MRSPTRALASSAVAASAGLAASSRTCTQVERTEPALTTVSIESRFRMGVQLTGAGSHTQNFERLFDGVWDRLKI
jgi:hypothetical protein